MQQQRLRRFSVLKAELAEIKVLNFSLRPKSQTKVSDFGLRLKFKTKKGKVFPYSLPSVGPGADPGVQAVSPQVT